MLRKRAPHVQEQGGTCNHTDPRIGLHQSSGAETHTFRSTRESSGPRLCAQADAQPLQSAPFWLLLQMGICKGSRPKSTTVWQQARMHAHIINRCLCGPLHPATGHGVWLMNQVSRGSPAFQALLDFGNTPIERCIFSSFNWGVPRVCPAD